MGETWALSYDTSMLIIARLLYVAGGLLFVVSLAAHVYARIRLRPSEDSDLDDYYYEFEDEHPEYARYSRWLRVTMAGAALGVVMLFAAIAV